MPVNLTNMDIGTRYALQEDFDNGFVGRDRQVVIQTDDPKGYRPIIMDGVTQGGKSKVLLLEDKASTAQAIEGADDNTFMTPSKVKEAIVSGSYLKNLILSIFFPVGSIYMDATGNIDPNTQFGGTWTKIEDRFLLASGTKGVGWTGGEERVTLNTDHLPPHYHSRGNQEITAQHDDLIAGPGSRALGAFTSTMTKGSNGGKGGSSGYFSYVKFAASKTWYGQTSSNGGGQSHNNMPPYEVVAIWKRTA